jgi:hypothetical protein
MIELPNIIKLEDWCTIDTGEITLFSEEYVIFTHISNVVIYSTKGGDTYARILHT